MHNFSMTSIYKSKYTFILKNRMFNKFYLFLFDHEGKKKET